jgi:mannose-P-dolichol utilization defect protein 1
MENAPMDHDIISRILEFVATWIWGDNAGGGEPSPLARQCLDAIPWMNSECWSRLLAKAVGVGIIMAACLNKMPVMLNLWKSQSTQGLSRYSVYGEAVMYANATFYGWLSQFPFTSYGENASLLMQTLVLVAMLWKFGAEEKDVSRKEPMSVILFAVGYVVVILWLLPKDWYSLLMTSIVPILVYARGLQIYKTQQCQHTGAQSVVTLTMNVAGGCVRILTTLQEIGWDTALLFSTGTGCLINIIMLLQYFYYKSNTDKFLAGLQRKEEKIE